MGISDTSETWETLSSRRPFQGAKTAVASDMVRMPDRSVVRRDYQVHPGSVCVLALDAQDRVLVIRQYRHPVRHRLWELPAGLLDVPGENPLHAAQRELYEEAHVKAEDWRVLADFFASPGGSDEAIRIFLARGVGDAEGERYEEHDSEEADMEVAWVPLPDLVRGVLAGELANPGLVTGVLALAAATASPEGPEGLRPALAPWPARPYEA
ncbi:NUDIX domain-containing protein [Streptomyces sp. NPDC057939]|uniref:NUDIX domain-containing protein n=1 Tax=Streptomyces sp. NPDC057939 TaxID=3346284 RepID=UPI0036DFFC60